MEGKDRAGEGTFRVTFGEEGAAKLGERLTEKLKEYMGEFVDDTLVVWTFEFEYYFLLFLGCCLVN